MRLHSCVFVRFHGAGKRRRMHTRQLGARAIGRRTHRAVAAGQSGAEVEETESKVVV